RARPGAFKAYGWWLPSAAAWVVTMGSRPLWGLAQSRGRLLDLFCSCPGRSVLPVKSVGAGSGGVVIGICGALTVTCWPVRHLDEHCGIRPGLAGRAVRAECPLPGHRPGRLCVSETSVTVCPACHGVACHGRVCPDGSPGIPAVLRIAAMRTRMSR